MTTTLLLVETVVLAVLCVLVAGLLRAYGTVLRRLHELDGGGGGTGGAQNFSLLPMPAIRPQSVEATHAPTTSSIIAAGGGIIRCCSR